MSIPDPAVTVPSQQFFDLDKFDPGFDNYNQMSRMTNRNPRFAWPKNYFRQIDGRVVELQRGYIRLLLPTADTARAQATPRCFFQFNPDSITRGITARNDVQLWVNQDPGQLGQPLYGDQNFSFELLFNREAEVAAGIDELHNLGGRDTSPTIQDGAVINGGSQAETSVYRPQEVGVLADLAVLDAVIGVGISESTVKQQVDAYNARQRYAASKTTVDASGNSSTTTTSYPQITSATTFAQANVGNKAFLMPNPVRIIFSRLFMLDGYIQSIQVTFNKFSPSMVPTQCSVAIQMQALYFGFAQKDTFLTSYLDGSGSSGGSFGGTGGGAYTPTSPQVAELLDLRDNLIVFGKHNNGGSEKINEFGVNAPSSEGNKITFDIILSPSYKAWKERTKADVKLEPWLLYEVYDGDLLLFSGSAPGKDQNVGDFNGQTVMTVSFFPTRPATMAAGYTGLPSNGSYRYKAAIHVDIRVGETFLTGSQNIRFDKAGLSRDSGFDFGGQFVGFE